MEANYKVLRNEILDDYSIFTYSENVVIESINAVSTRSEFQKNNYFSQQSQNIFPTGKDILFKLNLENKIDTDINLTGIEIVSPNNEIKINSPLLNFFNSGILSILGNTELTMIKRNSEICIPITLRSTINFNGIIGKIIFHWTDARNNNNSLVNCFENSLPDIEIKSNDIEVTYDIQGPEGKNPRELKIMLNNSSKEFKKVTFILENSPNFVINGPVKKRVLIYPKERKELIFSVLPLYYGNLKLPPFKLIEDTINPGTPQPEAEKKQVILVPDTISVVGVPGNLV